jgi:hypothetical protein
MRAPDHVTARAQLFVAFRLRPPGTTSRPTRPIK